MSVIGEAALAAFFDALFSKLAEFLNVVTEKQVREELLKWENILPGIQAVLDNAEEKHVKDRHVKRWLTELQHLAYDADDVLDEFATKALRRNLTREHQYRSSKLQKFLHTCFSHNFSSNTEMMSMIKEITTRFQELAERRSALALTENVGGRPKRAIERPPTTSLVTETQVYGRANDKEAIFELISNRNVVEICVIPIVGMGGIGKTTLAQLVYNDNQVNDYFDLKAWVCVSEIFDIKDITKSILSSIGHESPDAGADLNNLQIKLKQRLSGKRLLLILDDLWHQIYNDWTLLIAPFGKGTTIIVTTREQSVSSMTRTIPADHKLQKLSDEDCLSVLTHHALGANDFSRHPNLEEIGRKIVKKCNGLPLAAKTIGGLLRNKVDLDAWKWILESEIWNLPEERSNIIPALRISYHHLPRHLKRCFAYCAILPKDYEFTETEIVWLWMAEGFLRVGAVNRNEDLGQEIFQELVSRSFFERSNQDKSRYVMHDLINDLAQSIAKDLCFRVEGDKELDISNNARHSSYIGGRRDGIKKFRIVNGMEHLRTFLPLKMPDEEYCYISNQVLFDLLSKLKCLRVLSLEGYHLTKLLDVFGDLIHLRYLNFSHTPIKTLPDSICKLYNLETLILWGCKALEEFPLEMRDLINLRHLDFTGANSQIRMPMGIGELTSLQTLTRFVVSRDNGLQIQEMEKLSNLKGGLLISGLENIVKAQDAAVAGLCNKSNLSDLTLEWKYSRDAFAVEEIQFHMDVLNSLRPHAMLERLTIQHYGGKAFPNWIGDPSFEKLSHLELDNCPNCTSLPAIGKVPLLKSLFIKNMNKVTVVGSNFFGENASIAFPKLEELFFYNMPEWQEWDPCEVDGDVFQQLRLLSISDCPKLLGSLPTRLRSLEELVILRCQKLRSLATCPPSLKKLEVRECEQLVVSLSSLTKLCKLKIEECQEVVGTSFTNFGSLMKSVSLSKISKFTCPMDMMLGLRKAESLSIGNCDELISSWLNQEDLGIGDCERLERLSKSLHSYTSLTVLQIERCPRLISFSKGNLPANLRSLTIRCCENLQYLLDERENVSINGTFFLEKLEIGHCKSFISLSVRCELPLKFISLSIVDCENLQYLLDERENISIEQLLIGFCQSLISLSARGDLPVDLQRVSIYNCEKKLASLLSNGKLPKGLKYLRIEACPSLESIAPEIEDNSSLKQIDIYFCENFRSLPRGFDNLNHLEEVCICGCPNLISFPGSGLLTPKLREFYLMRCEKLEALPNHMHNIVSLAEFVIYDCPSVVSFPEEGFPTNLISLEISQPNFCKSVIEWGLHKLTSLKHFCIHGASLDVASFPHEEMLLPPSLTSFSIKHFPNLEILSSKGFQNLTSLESLRIAHCPKLKFLPSKEMLPSLLTLQIYDSPLLKQRCEEDEWPNVAHVPHIDIW
ncbi:PREDICTED: putative disease resistance RPP13-like protein 1 [Theobroma cacao]|uniref:Disease resistance RPP13-like protein 1 n=1 Tax=Theobroma cacao TaxID=3641 RepID=A0AB32X359_THECC|nr:PREDICTED: putative disease resistance RPP13-like protein 1 [Theobroma cacao]XP_017984613.1 PREDICTED: putative disease resistance RPP13-like protein 1 [Theobroma cacao]XP_017984614.1 PREDICTED: putative disease resistance RPP13-like protein 1 [Theobroma cacao]XP_017984615.1 PREDICTED: putative disease resistance RPP13-like protein 1 [Theobroma cacao]XP_017984616.1 PREDICTED: putative disease resistance RPP13-like protein 1 [Theobroma cacao]XP_017984617.1 PREDICTED: putative disease resista